MIYTAIFLCLLGLLVSGIFIGLTIRLQGKRINLLSKRVDRLYSKTQPNSWEDILKKSAE